MHSGTEACRRRRGQTARTTRRNQRAQPGTDERHRLAHADAAAHRLRDLVECVALALRLLDLREGVRRPAAAILVPFLGGCIGPSCLARCILLVGRAQTREDLHEMCDERGVEPRPASRSRISSAASCDTDRRYGRSDVAASNVSTTARMRAPIGMSSPRRPSGYPVPSQRS